MADDATAAADAQVNDDPQPDQIEPSEPTKQPEADDAAELSKPGTPDKALQKMQQELGNVTRQLAALTEKKSEGELSEADKAKLAAAQQRVAKIRGFVSRPDRSELPSDIDDVAEHVLDLTDRVSEVDQLKALLKEANGKIDYLMNDHGWEKARGKYPGLDVDAIWAKANADAEETLGDSVPENLKPRAVNKLASRWFEERCNAAKKRQGDADPKAPKLKDAPPSTYKVGSGQRVAPTLSEEDEALSMARELVKEI